MYIGIDIGGTSAKIGLLNKGEVIEKHEVNVSFDNYDTPIIESVVKGLNEFISTYEINLDSVLGIGVSATGQIDVKLGKVIGTGGNLRNWDGTEIKSILEGKYKKNIRVMNDANSMVYAEYVYGKGQKFSNVLGLTIGTGIGGGIIANDVLIEGRTGVGGEIGHMSLGSDKKCTCGNVGCFEQYGSMTALIKTVRDSYVTQDGTLKKSDINGRYIFEQLEAGNKEIQKCVDEWINDISKGIVSLVHIFNPDIVLVGGAVSVQEELFMTPIRENVLRMVMPVFGRELIIEKASFGNDAGMIGAVASIEGKIR